MADPPPPGNTESFSLAPTPPQDPRRGPGPVAIATLRRREREKMK
ncbi:hypothetical protein chiPu_0028814, partial [Chiloscyllium punctatum]|nr:hypothetical protein [Chiloscyllium punctatum]